MKRHASETTLAHLQRHHTNHGTVLRLHERRSKCRECGMVHQRVRYQGYLDPSGKGEGNWFAETEDESIVGEVVAGVLVFLLLFFAVFWALPVIVTYGFRP